MKKIMFNDKYGLTDAVISPLKRKTQTRRFEINKNEQKALEVYNVRPSVKHNILYAVNPETQTYLFRKNTNYKVGEIVAIAQNYKDAGVRFIPREDDEFGCYDFPTKQTKGWNNKMYVRAELMPHRICITNVRIERLQDISDDDCMKEGIIHKKVSALKPYVVLFSKVIVCLGSTPREAYSALIDKVSGKGTWERNPYVVVYDYELVK